MSLVTKLRRFNLTVTKDKSDTDRAQVPASATLDVYRQGARIKTAFVVGPGEVPEAGPLEVYDVGRIVKGDSLKIFKDGVFSDGTLTVLAVTGATYIEVRNDSASTIAGDVGDRLVVTGSRPAIHKEISGSGSETYAGSQVDTDPETGALPNVYLSERFFDGILSDKGSEPKFSPKLMVDQASGHALRTFDIRDFGGDIQRFLTSCQRDSRQAALSTFRKAIGHRHDHSLSRAAAS